VVLVSEAQSVAASARKESLYAETISERLRLLKSLMFEYDATGIV